MLSNFLNYTSFLVQTVLLPDLPDIWVFNYSIWFASELAARHNNADIRDISKINENVTQTLFIILPISLTSEVSLIGHRYSLLSVIEVLLCPSFCFLFEREGLLPTGTIYLFPSVCFI